MSEKRAILIVDDDLLILLSIKQQLRLEFGRDYIYETAASAELGFAAIERLVSEGVDIVLIISDWLMPGMQGDDFLRRVHELHPAIKLMILSGHADCDQMESLEKELGLFATLGKPYKASALFDIINRAMACE
jgi:DNA-binding NtrC family response regulator